MTTGERVAPLSTAELASLIIHPDGDSLALPTGPCEHGANHHWIDNSDGPTYCDNHMIGKTGACLEPFEAWAAYYMEHLLATIAARDATVAAYREIVAAVADVTDRGTVSQGDPDWWYCMFGYRYDCDDGMDEERVTHSPNCPWTKARALLAGEAGDTTAADMTAQAAEEEGNTTTPS